MRREIDFENLIVAIVLAAAVLCGLYLVCGWTDDKSNLPDKDPPRPHFDRDG